MAKESPKTTRIRELNDAFRTTFTKGQIVLTPGVMALSAKTRDDLLGKVKAFNKFSEGNDRNDPYKEHDFGVIMHNNERFYWKIDYYDKELEHGSEDPSDPAQTTRVMTIMKASEY